MNIYVGNLNYRVKEDDLQKVMEDYGTVSSVKFIMDRATGRFRGIAFVEMEDSAAAAKAISELDGAEFFGRQMVVKEARPPKNRLYTIKSLRRSTKLLLKYFSRTILFSASSSGVP